jgi:hypothetical protein
LIILLDTAGEEEYDRREKNESSLFNAERAESRYGGKRAACPTIEGTARRQSAVATRRSAADKAMASEEDLPYPPHFCQTKPFVMLKKMHLYDSERKGCADYRKMTTGFVF